MTGRPPYEIDLTEVERLAQVCDSEEEVARALGISYSTLRRKKKTFEQFGQALKNGRAKANVFVGGKLMEKIRNGDTACIIFYLKSRCGWRETQRVEADVVNRAGVPEGLPAIYAALKKSS